MRPCRPQHSGLVPASSRLLLPLLAAVVWGSGCAHRATISSDPPGAQVRLGSQYLGVTPMEVRVGRWPWSPNVVQVSLAGRRWTELELSRWKRKSEHEVLLVRRHGRAGTWTPEDAEQ